MESWWNFSRFYLKEKKENKFLIANVKDQSDFLKRSDSLKNDSNICLYIFQNCYGLLFYRTFLVAAFEVSFSISK